MTLKSRSTTAIIIAIVLIAVATLIWAWTSGKITIFGDQAVVPHSYVNNLAEGGGDNTTVIDGKIQLKPTTVQSGGGWTRLNDDWEFLNFKANSAHSAIWDEGNGRILMNTIDKAFAFDLSNNSWRSGNGNSGDDTRPTYLFSSSNGIYNVGPVNKPETDSVWKWSDGEPFWNGVSHITNNIPQGTCAAGAGGFTAPALSGAATATDGNSLFLLGGTGNGLSYPGYLRIFHTSDNTWCTYAPEHDNTGQHSSTDSIPFELKRTGMTMAYVPPSDGYEWGRMMVFGGYNGSYYNDLWQLDVKKLQPELDNGAWSRIKPDGDGVLSPRAFTKMVYDQKNNQLLLFGGKDGGQYFNDLYAMNLNNQTWQKLQANLPGGASDRPGERANHELVIDQGNALYLISGGIYGGNGGYNDVWKYTIPEQTTTYQSGTWTSMLLGGNIVERFLSFDSKHEIFPGTEASMPDNTRIIYEIVNADKDPSDPHYSLAATSSADVWNTFMNLSDPNMANWPDGTKRFDGAKNIRVKVHLQTDNPSATPWTKGFVLKYQTYGDYLPTKPPTDLTAEAQNISIPDLTNRCIIGAKAGWKASPDIDLQGYYVYYSPEITPDVRPPIPTSAIATVDKNTLTYDLTGLTGSTKYYLWVKAFGPGGQSTPVATDFTTLACPVQDLPVITFNANPLTINAGQPSTLTWTITNADSASIDNEIGTVALNGNTTIEPAQTTTYTLTATKNGQSATKSVTVTINSLPVIISSFRADPPTIASGQSSTLSWAISGADSATINNETVDKASGTKSVSPTQTTTYTLTATKGTINYTAKVVVTVTSVTPPVVSAFNATPPTITIGQSSTLSWNVTGADSVSINNGIGNVALTGNTSVTPAGTTTYTLTATKGNLTTTAQAIVTVMEATPVISTFSANPQAIDKGSNSTLSWNITGATSATIDNNVGNVDKTSGTKSVSPTSDTTYTLTATNASGNTTATVRITVRPDANGPTAPTNLTGTPISNNSIKLTWNASTDNIGVTGYDIYDATNNQLIGTTDTTEITLSGLSCNTTYKYYVKAHDAAGNVSDASNTVEVKTGACTGNAGEQGSTAAIAGISKLVSTGSALWFNLLIAIALAAAIAYFLIWRKRNQEM